MNTIKPAAGAAGSGFQNSQQGLPESQAGAVDRGIPGLTPTKKKTSVAKFFVWVVMVVALTVGIVFGVVFVKRWQATRAAASAGKPLDGVSTPVGAGTTARKAANLAQDRKEIVEAKAAADREAAKEKVGADVLPVPAGASAPVPAIAVSGRSTGDGGRAAGVSSASSRNAAPSSSGTQAALPMTPAERKLDGGVLAFEPASKTASLAHDQREIADVKSMVSTASFAGAKPDALEQELHPATLVDGKARRRTDLSMLLRRGTMLPCVENTEIITGLPGLISCHLAKDVYSADGSVVLLEKGSEVTGEQRRGPSRGVKRIFVLWNRVETSNGVSVEIDSPGTDQLGAAGMDAWVDEHWLDRFGAAIMLSVIDDVVASAMAKDTNNQTVTFTNTANASQQLATKALESTINIPPTAYSYHGSRLQIYVARDIDFRGVYELRPQ